MLHHFNPAIFLVAVCSINFTHFFGFPQYLLCFLCEKCNDIPLDITISSTSEDTVREKVVRPQELLEKQGI